ncbi:hypothetical protein GP486_002179 [Trichoglossum hirsutum]|uniref:YTH domain-containing protein n=1 Tax=Trichoglossum hirsutum TaxID=265104 RepID=A0A9P8LFF5_9PEZI|nr:hypothetical protein GP486_002179 [Trichoglossum hirsutum]
MGPVPQQTYSSEWDQEMWQHNNSHTGYGHGNFQQGGFDSHLDHRVRPFFQPVPQDVLPYDGAPHGQEEWVTEDPPGYFDEQINGEPEYHNMPASQHYQPQATYDGANDHFGSRQIRNPTIKPAASKVPASASANTAPPSKSDKPRSTSTPTLSNSAADLKARVIASVSRKRAENSSTPTQGTVATKDGSTDATAAVNNSHMNIPESSDPKTSKEEKNDIRTDIDGLVAEAKAATSTSVKNGSFDAEGDASRQKTSSMLASRTGSKNGDVLVAKTGTSTIKQKTDLLNRASKMGTAGSSGSADTSEVGEIREEPGDSRSIDDNRRNVRGTQQSSGNSGEYSYMDIDEEISSSAIKSTSHARQDTSKSNDRTISEPIHRDIIDDGALFRNRDDRQAGGRASRRFVEIERSPLTSPRGDPIEIQRQIDYRRQQLYRATDPDDTQRRTNPRLASEYEQPPSRQYVDDGLRLAPGESTIYYSTDVEDWLEMTHYHEREYRTEALRRFRELRALQARQNELQLESEAAKRRVFLRGQPVNSTGEVSSSSSKTFYVNPRNSIIYDMPPPPLPDRDDLTTRIATRSPAVFVTSRHADEPVAVRYVESPPPMVSEGSSLKRRYSGRDVEFAEPGPAEKLQRVEPRDRASSLRDEVIVASSQHRYARNPMEEGDELETTTRRREALPHGRAASRSAYDRQVRRSLSPLPRTSGASQYRGAIEEGVRIAGSSQKNRGSYSREMSPSHRRPEGNESSRTEPHRPSPREDYRDQVSHRREPDEDFRGGQQHRSYYEYNGRGGYSGRGRGRGGSYGYRNNGRYIDRGGKQTRLENRTSWDFRGRKGDTRYFMVKSFNSENVTQAQEEDVWATQEKNAELFSEAFRNTRNVILIFSVNKSAAFQGYARMESEPGTAQKPSWANTLLWKSSGPFRIKWITIAETRFNRVSHLRNPLNEDQPVLIGRDGQEIEEECGAALCDIIDQEADRMRN